MTATCNRSPSGTSTSSHMHFPGVPKPRNSTHFYTPMFTQEFSKGNLACSRIIHCAREVLSEPQSAQLQELCPRNALRQTFLFGHWGSTCILSHGFCHTLPFAWFASYKFFQVDLSAGTVPWLGTLRWNGSTQGSRAHDIHCYLQGFQCR